MADWSYLCRIDDVPDGRGVTFEISGLSVAILRDGGTVAALMDRCPHSGGSLGQGWVEESEVVCPLHRWRFRLSDGRCTTIRGEGVHRFRVELRGEEIWVLV